MNTRHVGEHGLTRDDLKQALADPEREPADAYDTPRPYWSLLSRISGVLDSFQTIELEAKERYIRNTPS